MAEYIYIPVDEMRKTYVFYYEESLRAWIGVVGNNLTTTTHPSESSTSGRLSSD